MFTLQTLHFLLASSNRLRLGCINGFLLDCIIVILGLVKPNYKVIANVGSRGSLSGHANPPPILK